MQSVVIESGSEIHFESRWYSVGLFQMTNMSVLRAIAVSYIDVSQLSQSYL